MAVKRIQKNRVNSTGGMDVIHYETEASITYMQDGRSVEDAVNELAEGAGQGGGTGEDGGYYAPEVSSEGELSWTPSKETMPAVAPANIKGPKGDPGLGAHSFEVNADGDLVMSYEGDVSPNYTINEAGDLILTVEGGNSINLGRVKGDPGADGTTLTNEDIAEIVTLVLQQLPNGDEVSY